MTFKFSEQNSSTIIWVLHVVSHCLTPPPNPVCGPACITFPPPPPLCSGDWSELSQLELIRLDQNSINGQLPPSWSKLRRLRMLTLWDNDLEGQIPESWADLQVCL